MSNLFQRRIEAGTTLAYTKTKHQINKQRMIKKIR